MAAPQLETGGVMSGFYPECLQNQNWYLPRILGMNVFTLFLGLGPSETVEYKEKTGVQCDTSHHGAQVQNVGWGQTGENSKN